MPQDPFDLQRFVDAQRPVHDQALAELAAGRKRSHWMWFVFPQLAGLGSSPTAVRYAIGGAEEARAYLAHPVLGARLAECTGAVLASGASDAEAVFGGVDARKFHSSLTLFALLAPAGSVYERALDRFFSGRPDARSLALLGAGPGEGPGGGDAAD